MSAILMRHIKIYDRSVIMCEEVGTESAHVENDNGMGATDF